MPRRKSADFDRNDREPTTWRLREYEAVLDEFIGRRPDVLAYFNGLSNDELVRKVMHTTMRRSETAQRGREALAAWVNANPDMPAKVEARLKTRRR
jgi:hypothetical protein